MIHASQAKAKTIESQNKRIKQIKDKWLVDIEKKINEAAGDCKDFIDYQLPNDVSTYVIHSLREYGYHVESNNSNIFRISWQRAKIAEENINHQ